MEFYMIKVISDLESRNGIIDDNFKVIHKKTYKEATDEVESLLLEWKETILDAEIDSNTNGFYIKSTDTCDFVDVEIQKIVI